MNPADFSNFLFEIDSHSLPVIDPEIPPSKYVPLDLSIHNPHLKNVDVSNVEALEAFVNTQINHANGMVAYGGYLEQRAIYDRSDYFNSEATELVRNIHLGMDLWLASGSSIFTPLNGEVHSFQNNLNFGDYGPTIILKHRIASVEFHTLYGHLSQESLQGLKLGQEFKKGKILGTLGSALVNGNYPPHLHFQIIRDMQGYFGDYPGVSSQKDLENYRQNCPDPNVLLKITS